MDDSDGGSCIKALWCSVTVTVGGHIWLCTLACRTTGRRGVGGGGAASTVALC